MDVSEDSCVPDTLPYINKHREQIRYMYTGN
jgi:hypothetical protein